MKITEKHRVSSPTDAVYYLPDFITADEESYLLRKVWSSEESTSRLEPSVTSFMILGTKKDIGDSVAKMEICIE